MTAKRTHKQVAALSRTAFLLIPVAGAVVLAITVRRESAEAAPIATLSRVSPCDADNGGITLPAGFCASVFADKIGKARHPVVAPNGDVYVALQPGKLRGAAQAPSGGVAVLRDTDHDGKSDKTEFFGPFGGGGIRLQGNFLYLDVSSAILRYRMTPGAMTPTGAPDTIVSGLPTGGNHTSRDMELDGKGNMYVNVGSSTNVCQSNGRDLHSAGIDPCTELETRAGIWKFSDSQVGQKFSPSARLVTGLRNAVGLAWNTKDNTLYSTQHGRDSFVQGFPELYNAKKSAENPAEELVQIHAGDNFGWPYCYYDNDLKKLVQAPEYGGDAKKSDRCQDKKAPLVAFPGHWAPNALTFYTGGAGTNAGNFPARFRDGAYIAFHGSWNRAPEPQAGYKVVFVPSSANKFDGKYETFADGFAGLGDEDRSQGAHRPTGLAFMPDGSLIVTDDTGGRVYRVVYTGAK